MNCNGLVLITTGHGSDPRNRNTTISHKTGGTKNEINVLLNTDCLLLGHLSKVNNSLCECVGSRDLPAVNLRTGPWANGKSWFGHLVVVFSSSLRTIH